MRIGVVLVLVATMFAGCTGTDPVQTNSDEAADGTNVGTNADGNGTAGTTNGLPVVPVFLSTPSVNLTTAGFNITLNATVPDPAAATWNVTIFRIIAIDGNEMVDPLETILGAGVPTNLTRTDEVGVYEAMAQVFFEGMESGNATIRYNVTEAPVLGTEEEVVEEVNCDDAEVQAPIRRSGTTTAGTPLVWFFTVINFGVEECQAKVHASISQGPTLITMRWIMYNEEGKEVARSTNGGDLIFEPEPNAGGWSLRLEPQASVQGSYTIDIKFA